MGNKVVRVINKVVVYAFLLLTTLFVMYPLVYVVSAAFAPGSSIASLSIIPFGNGVTTEHFKNLFENTLYVTWFKNTLIIAVATSGLTIIVSSLAAYVFSRFRFTMKKSMMMSMLILQIFPAFVGMVAIYVILLRINGLDTLWGLILVYLAGNIPYNTWMDYIFPKMVLRSSNKQTLALGLFNFVTDKKNEFTNFAAGALLVAIPFVIFFALTQKIMVTSLGGSAVKE